MKPPRWKQALLAVDQALAWSFDHILLCLAVAAIVLMAIVADEYGGDEIEHHRATALTVEDRAAESRYLKAEAAMERDLAVATSAAR